jgi:hypothetical protein
LNYVFIFLLFSFLIIINICLYSKLSLLKLQTFRHFLSLSSNISTNDFRLYPESRSAIEYNRIQIDNIAKSIFIDYKNEGDKNLDYSKPLNYSETLFRSASIPIIWLDATGDVHWNRAAQYELLNYLLEKQYPNDNISICLSQQLFILEQWRNGGFFSRHHCLIEQFGQTLYSPSMVLVSLKRFIVSHSPHEDFQSEGILRYYQSISLCSSHLNHPKLKTLYDYIKSLDDKLSDIKLITNVHELLDRDESTVRYKYSRDVWKFSYDHVPHRRWLFDRNREEIKKILNYNSSISLLINHSNEHIYYSESPSLNLAKWTPRNAAQGDPTDFLKG